MLNRKSEEYKEQRRVYGRKRSATIKAGMWDNRQKTYKQREAQEEPSTSIDEFKRLAEIRLKKIPLSYNKPLFKPGDTIKTRTHHAAGKYLALVIGYGTLGTVLTEEQIPLIDFGGGRTFYLCQEKLKKVTKDVALSHQKIAAMSKINPSPRGTISFTKGHYQTENEEEL